MSRDPALLTPSQRDLLRGEAEYETKQSETNARYRMRKRIRDSLRDFELLTERVNPDDRKQVFAELHPLSDEGDDAEDLPLRQDEVSGIIDAIAFLHSSLAKTHTSVV